MTMERAKRAFWIVACLVALYSGPMNSDSRMGVAKVHSDHDPQTLHAQPESRRRARSPEGRRNPAPARLTAWDPSEPAAQLEGPGLSRSAQPVHRRRAGQTGTGS